MEMVRTSNPRRGSSLVEFALLGIPVIFLLTSVIAASLDMWQFFTLSYATEIAARYAGMHGATCTANSNSCTITIGSVVTLFEKQSIALNKAKVTVKFTDGSGTTTCNPVSSCEGSATQYPASANNTVGSSITVAATYSLVNPVVMLWPGSNGVKAGTFTVGATSTQPIVF